MKRNHFAIRRALLILLVCFMSCSLMAQKVNPDTLTIDQLNLYQHKAIAMRNAGIILTSCGPVVTTLSIVLGLALEEDYFLVSAGAGIASTVIGIPLWIAGGSRNNIGKILALDFDELNLYKDKAVTLRNTGMILTLSGIGLLVAGSIAGVTQDVYSYSYIPEVVSLIGIASTVVGTPIWAAGGGRKANAELTLQRFRIAPENSMAVGLGIKLRF